MNNVEYIATRLKARREALGLSQYDHDLTFRSDGEQLVASFDITKTERAS